MPYWEQGNYQNWQISSLHVKENPIPSCTWHEICQSPIPSLLSFCTLGGAAVEAAFLPLSPLAAAAPIRLPHFPPPSYYFPLFPWEVAVVAVFHPFNLTLSFLQPPFLHLSHSLLWPLLCPHTPLSSSPSLFPNHCSSDSLPLAPHMNRASKVASIPKDIIYRDIVPCNISNSQITSLYN